MGANLVDALGINPKNAKKIGVFFDFVHSVFCGGQTSVRQKLVNVAFRMPCAVVRQ